MKRAFVLGAILLSGCVSPQEQAEMQRQGAYQEQRQEEAYMARLAARCNQFGFATGSEQFSQCMMSLHQQNQANFGAAAAALLANQPQPVRPRCSSLPPGIAGYEAAQGRCY